MAPNFFFRKFFASGYTSNGGPPYGPRQYPMSREGYVGRGAWVGVHRWGVSRGA